MIDSIFLTVFIAGLFVNLVYKLTKFCWMSWFDGTLKYYYIQSTKESTCEPLIFIHDGKQYKVFVKHEKIKNHMNGTKLSRSNVFINDNLVLMVSRMRNMIIVKRSIDIDLKYVNSDIFKILKWARKHCNEQFNVNCECEFESIKLIK